MDQINMTEQFDKYNKATVESLKSLGAINARVYDKLAAVQRDFVTQMLDLGNQLAGTTTDLRDVQEFVTRQTQLLTTCNEKLLGAARTATEIMLSSREEYQHWFEDGMKTAGVNAPAAFTMPNVFGVKKAA
jgi:actin-like ATPase involved in cell morphogenesis